MVNKKKFRVKINFRLNKLVKTRFFAKPIHFKRKIWHCLQMPRNKFQKNSSIESHKERINTKV